jgi:hypothetical protein
MGGLQEEEIMRSRLLAVITAAVLAGLVVSMSGLSTARAEDAQWTAEYWNGTKFQGAPDVTQLEDKIYYRWGTDSPIPGTINENRFVVRWTRVVHFDDDFYVFRTFSDDGIRVWVDDELIVDQWDDHPYQTFTIPIDMDEGEFTLTVEYYENRGLAGVGLSWARLRPDPWTVQYFKGTNLSGKVVEERDENVLKYFWGASAPVKGVSGKNFSARFIRDFDFPGGQVRFRITVGGGFRLYVGNKLIMDHWFDHGVVTDTAKANINAGTRQVTVEYFASSYPATIKFRIER